MVTRKWATMNTKCKSEYVLPAIQSYVNPHNGIEKVSTPLTNKLKRRESLLFRALIAHGENTSH